MGYAPHVHEWWFPDYTTSSPTWVYRCVLVRECACVCVDQIHDDVAFDALLLTHRFCRWLSHVLSSPSRQIFCARGIAAHIAVQNQLPIGACVHLRRRCEQAARWRGCEVVMWSGVLVCCPVRIEAHGAPAQHNTNTSPHHTGKLTRGALPTAACAVAFADHANLARRRRVLCVLHVLGSLCVPLPLAHRCNRKCAQALLRACVSVRVCVSCLCVTGGAVVMPAARFLLPRDGHRQHCTRTCDDLTFCFACIRALFSPRPRFSICGTSSHRGLCPVFLSAATLCITSKTARSASTPSTRTRATTSKASRKQPLCT